MTTASPPTVPPALHRPWPTWISQAMAGWATAYAAVQIAWIATGTSVAWSPHSAVPPWALAAFALLALGATWAVRADAISAGRIRTAVLGLAVAAFAIGMASMPACLLMLLSLSGVESVTGFVHDVLCAVGFGHHAPDPGHSTRVHGRFSSVGDRQDDLDLWRRRSRGDGRNVA